MFTALRLKNARGMLSGVPTAIFLRAPCIHRLLRQRVKKVD
jgi:hypothetical protein